MIYRRLAASLGALAVLVGCAPAPPPTAVPTATPSASPTALPTSTPTPTPTATASPWGSDRLPFTYRIVGSLLENAPAVVGALQRAAAFLPVLKLDITSTQATLTALTPDDGVVSYRWGDGQITAVDSDVQYLGQSTFDPADFPLDSVGRMFDIADLRGVSGELVLQVLDYHDGVVLMAVTSRRETGTVFFTRDGAAVPPLGVTSVEDLTAGVQAVAGSAPLVYSVSISAADGYRADLPHGDGTILTRTRRDALPAFSTEREESAAAMPFDPALIDPSALARSIARYQEDTAGTCAVTIDRSLGRSAPVARFDCADATFYTDMDGRDMTTLVG
ncbi:MAG TPA: hypothetical protein PKE40_04280 [Arachnia sp.]|nr:hypothetical protein [Arachnia sp.]HMT85550.1 hypothetical protein [Arachnia sp.]